MGIRTRVDSDFALASFKIFCLWVVKKNAQTWNLNTKYDIFILIWLGRMWRQKRHLLRPMRPVLSTFSISKVSWWSPSGGRLPKVISI